MVAEDGQRLTEKSECGRGYERLFDYVPPISRYQGRESVVESLTLGGSKNRQKSPNLFFSNFFFGQPIGTRLFVD